MTTANGSTASGSSPLAKVLAVAERLAPVRRSGSGYSTLCPAHEDRKPSLSVTDKGEKVLVYCHAGCSVEAVCSAWGITTADLFADDKPRPLSIVKKKPTVVEEYRYENENGDHAFSVKRLSDKSFRAFSPDGKAGIEGIERVPFRLTAIIEAAKDGVPIWIVEGEKDVVSLETLGLVATTSPFGAGKWEEGFARYFAGAEVEVVADNDKPGIEHARKVAKSLVGVAKSVRLRVAPGEKGADVSDLIERGGTRDELVPIEEVKEVVSREDIEGSIISADPDIRQQQFIDAYLKPSQYRSVREGLVGLVENAIDLPGLSMIYGASGSGKSFVAVDLAMSVATGRDWAGRKVTKSPVVIVGAEDPDGLHSRITAWLTHHGEKDPESVGILTIQPTIEEGHCADIATIALNEEAGLIIFDTLRDSSNADENDSEAWKKISVELRWLAQVTGACVLVVHHSGKNKSLGDRGTSARWGSMDTVLYVSGSGKSGINVTDVKPNGKQRRRSSELDEGFTITPVEGTKNSSGGGSEAVAVWEKISPKAKEGKARSEQVKAIVESLDQGQGVTSTAIAEEYRRIAEEKDEKPPSATTVARLINDLKQACEVTQPRQHGRIFRVASFDGFDDE